MQQLPDRLRRATGHPEPGDSNGTHRTRAFVDVPARRSCSRPHSMDRPPAFRCFRAASTPRSCAGRRRPVAALARSCSVASPRRGSPSSSNKIPILQERLLTLTTLDAAVRASMRSAGNEQGRPTSMFAPRIRGCDPPRRAVRKYARFLTGLTLLAWPPPSGLPIGSCTPGRTRVRLRDRGLARTVTRPPANRLVTARLTGDDSRFPIRHAPRPHRQGRRAAPMNRPTRACSPRARRDAGTGHTDRGWRTIDRPDRLGGVPAVALTRSQVTITPPPHVSETVMRRNRQWRARDPSPAIQLADVDVRVRSSAGRAHLTWAVCRPLVSTKSGQMATAIASDVGTRASCGSSRARPGDDCRARNNRLGRSAAGVFGRPASATPPPRNGGGPDAASISAARRRGRPRPADLEWRVNGGLMQSERSNRQRDVASTAIG